MFFHHNRRFEHHQAKMERRWERHQDRMERRAERHEEHYERRANRDMERHMKHLERLGLDPRAAFASMGPHQAGYMYPPPGPGYGAGYGGPGPYGPQGPGYPNASPYNSSPALAAPSPYAPAAGYGPPPGAPPNAGYAPPAYAPPPGAGYGAPSPHSGHAGPQPYRPSPSPGPPEYYPPGVAYVAQNGVHVHQEDTKKKWYELDESKRSALATGGLVIGLAAIAGGAYYVYQKHKKEGEAMKAQAWEVQNWMMQSNQKTESFLNDKGTPKEAATWIYSAHIDDVKNDLIPGGEEGGIPWYIARAPHDGGLLVGKCRPEVGAFIGSDKEAIQVKAYDILVGDQKAVKWVPHKGSLNVKELGAQPVQGGHESDGTHLAIARAHVKDNGVLGIGGSGIEGVFPGKVSVKSDGAEVTVGEKEVTVKEYEVLCYA